MKKQQPSSLLEVKSLRFTYSEREVIRGVSFILKDGDILGISGESGSGKTSLLKLLSGFLPVTSGEVRFKGNLVKGPGEQLVPGHDQIKLVNQDFDLMPYLPVNDNILRKSLSESQATRQRILGHFKSRLKLRETRNREVEQISGGQKQRVALATALASKPEILLLDEPFSNLDYALKQEVIYLLKNTWRPRGMIVVTHEPADLLGLVDHILILKGGRIIQQGSAEEVYENPKNEYAGKLMGPVNILTPGQMAVFGRPMSGKQILRPHHFTINMKEGVKCEVKDCRYTGYAYLLDCYCAAIAGHLWVVAAEKVEPGKSIMVVLQKNGNKLDSCRGK